MSTPAERPHFLRLVRWAAASLLCILGATLSITSLSSYWVVHGAQQTVAWGQGESFVQALDRATQRGLHTEEAVLRSVLESETPHGLRCIVLFDRERASEESAATVSRKLSHSAQSMARAGNAARTKRALNCWR
jgi:hypothetical protein